MTTPAMPLAPVQQLAAEAGRIVTSPFCASLKTLDSLLKRVGNDAVQKWSEEHPCQVPHLAGAVLEALPTWSYALMIMERLCQVAAFRDAVVKRDPSLLHSLLTKSTGGHPDHQKYGSLCCALLRHRLPDGVPLPAIAQTFLLRVLNEAIASPGTKSFVQLLILSNGACAAIFDTLPDENLARLEEGLLGVLKHEKAVDNSGRNVSALALLAHLFNYKHIVATPKESSDSLSPDLAHYSSRRCDLSATAQVFNGTRASKVTDLIASYIVFYCSEGCELSTFETTTSIRLIITIVRTLSEETRQEWIRFKGQTLRKLCEKALSTKIDPPIRLWTVVFISSLCSIRKIPERIITAYESLLLDSSILSTTTDDYSCLLQHSLEKMGPFLTSSFVNTFLQKVFSMVTNDSISLITLKNSQTLVEAVAEIARSSSSFRKEMFLALCTNEFSPRLVAFMEFEPRIQDSTRGCLKGESLARPLMEQRCNLGSILCRSLLKLALLARGDDDIGIDPTTASALVDKQVMFGSMIPSLAHDHSPLTCSKQTGPLPDQIERQEESQEHINWRTWLSDEVERRAKEQEDMIIRSVTQACRESEERSDDIERLLRLQQEKQSSLQQDYNDANSCISELRAKSTERETYVSKLETKNSKSHSRTHEAETAADDLKCRLEDLERRLKDTEEVYQESTRKIREETDDRVLTVEAMCAAKEEAIEKCNCQLHEWKIAHQALKDSLEHTVNDLERSRQREHDQAKQIDSVLSELEAEKAQLSDQTEACLDAHRKIDCIEQEAKSVESRLFSTETELRELRRTHNQLIEDSKREIRILRDTHQVELNEALSQANQRETGLETKLQEIKAEFTEAKKLYDMTTHQAEANIEHLRGENMTLVAAGKEREAELKIAHDKLHQIGGLSNIRTLPAEESICSITFPDNESSFEPPKPYPSRNALQSVCPNQRRESPPAHVGDKITRSSIRAPR